MARLHSAIYKHLKIGGSYKSLDGLKNSERGKPCFVIANGPSLEIEDLDLLERNNVVTIGSNKIYRCFDQTRWRPKYFTVADYLNAENDNREIDELSMIKFIPYSLKSFFKNKEDVFYFNELSANIDTSSAYVPRFSFDATEGFHVGHTVTHLNIQIAAFLGCNPIYIIGMDGSYKVPQTNISHDVMENAVESDHGNHFIKDYYSESEKWAMPRTDLIDIEHDLDNQAVLSEGRKIYNASRRSAIKSFERISMSDIKF
jgi:hypothetical protein